MNALVGGFFLCGAIVRFFEDDEASKSSSRFGAEDSALNRRDASGSAEGKDDEGEVPRSLSKVVA